MEIKKSITRTLFLTAFVVGMSSQGFAITVQDFPDTASASDEVTKLNADMNLALKSQVDVLSPKNFEKAQDALEDAKKSLDKQKRAKDTLGYVAKGRAYLNSANAFTKLSYANIREVVLARKQAIMVGAPDLFSKDFKKVDKDLKNVTSDIEKNDLDDAIKKRASLQLKYLDLELRSIKQISLQDAKDKIIEAEKVGAKKYAPRSLAIAQKSVQETEAYITSNRENIEQINIRSAETLKNAKHLLKITLESKSGKKVSSEDHALKMENEKDKVADKQSQLEYQANQLENKQRQLARGENENLELTASNLSLESEQALNQKFEEARSNFSESEAEVYKQGNMLVIRLKGLAFPVSQSVLKSSNFSLLAKVQKVIKNFGKSSVIIEGHTDSMGDSVLNQKLSTDRADAVKEYLLSNSIDKSLDIKTVGYGYQKPLASNKTSNGRAQNRRVDVLISPDNSVIN